MKFMNLAKEMEKGQWLVFFVTTYDTFVTSDLSLLIER